MARSFSQSQFGQSAFEMGEDVNPSAYIVNLADCMLVLAVGFLVALVAYWNIDISMTDLSGENLAAVDPASLPQDLSSGGDYYVEAGTVYQDPQTGDLYMIETQEGAVDAATGSSSGDSGSASSAAASGSGAAAGSASASGTDVQTGGDSAAAAGSAGGASDDDIRNARANGGD